MKKAAFSIYLACVVSVLRLDAGVPQWIWQDTHGAAIRTNESCVMRKRFVLERTPTRARLSVAADDEATVYINGQQVAKLKGWDKPAFEEVTQKLRRGENVIAIRGQNDAGDEAGVVAVLDIKLNKQNAAAILTDTTWVSGPEPAEGWRGLNFDDSGWHRVVSRGTLGDKPWGDVLHTPKATPADALTVVDGFKVELVHSSEYGEGSWIRMATDSKGRLIISPQADNQPLLRITLTRSGQIKQIERIPAPLHQAMGLLDANHSLYVNGHGPNGTGLYRLIDSNHNDQFDTNEVHFLTRFAGEGEHGYHEVALGPDRKIYVVNGNHTKIPETIATNSPHTNYREDFLLPRQWDAGGHAVGILAPGGYIVRSDANGAKWELMLAGFRNVYGFDFNTEGEMFAFDSDMEWDWGLPWYRPTRILHCVSGAEFGWRSGSAKWPEYYPDSLPPVVNIGLGSPTGVKFGTLSRFPEQYRKALFAFDWSYGRIFAVHLRPTGSTYSGQYEVFLHGKPLNLADLAFGKDGAMYFITGGRGTQSGLYRVSYIGGAGASSRIASGGVETTVSKAEERAAAKARALRHRLEAFHGRKDPRAVDAAWPYLGSEDLFIRNAARIAIEWQDPALWKERALAETNTDAGLTALLALARCTGKESQRELLLALKKFPMDSLSVTQQLAKLRLIGLSFIRQGRPDADLAALAIEKLERLYPSNNELLNRELSQVLIYLNAPDVLPKTLALLDKAKTQEEQVHYIFHLRNVTNGWTLDQRKHYLEWFKKAEAPNKNEISYHGGSAYHVWNDQVSAADRHPPELIRWFKEVGREYGDGASYPKYLVNVRKEAVATMSESERIALHGLIEEKPPMAGYKPNKERHFVKAWTVADLEPSLSAVSSGRDYASGKAAFHDAQCILCHRFGNEGGSIGPELTAASSKYKLRDILESIIEPSKVVSEQFLNSVVVRKDGESEVGRVVDETDDKIVVETSPLLGESVEIRKSDIAERRFSKVSPMPEGLADQLTQDEMLDLLAYIESGGKEDAPNFKAVR